MKRLYTLLFTLSLGAGSAQAATKTVKHTIKNGETLYTIAHRNHTTISEVRKANGLKKGENLKIGRVLKVPKDTYFPNKNKKKIAKTNKSTKHAIKNGETLYTIAHRNHTTIEEVRKANGLKKGENLKIGRVLEVPQDTYSPGNKKSKVATKIKKKKFKVAAAPKKRIVKTKKTTKKLARKSKKSDRLL